MPDWLVDLLVWPLVAVLGVARFLSDWSEVVVGVALVLVVGGLTFYFVQRHREHHRRALAGTLVALAGALLGYATATVVTGRWL